jgi:hypothetical protein
MNQIRNRLREAHQPKEEHAGVVRVRTLAHFKTPPWQRKEMIATDWVMRTNIQSAQCHRTHGHIAEGQVTLDDRSKGADQVGKWLSGDELRHTSRPVLPTPFLAKFVQDTHRLGTLIGNRQLCPKAYQ